MAFPENFIWGASSAAFQLEGAATEEGKGLSVWDVFCQGEGMPCGGAASAVACDHYHRYREDVALMREIGLQAYRFSISWPRVMPEGTGRVNGAGLDFYDRLVDELLGAGIQPFATLFHWDFPYALHLRGGWLNRESADWFADYVYVVASRLGDRVRQWMTLNETQIFVWLGYQTGVNAPGLKLPMPELARIMHHVQLAHGKAVQALRSAPKETAVVGIASTGDVAIPLSESIEDIDAARLAMQADDGNLFSHFLWLDPIFQGSYWPTFQNLMDAGNVIQAGDMDIIRQPIDYIGLNIYFGTVIEAGAEGKPQKAPDPIGEPVSLLQWPVRPDSLYWGARFIHERYNVPIYITENGLSNEDWVSLDGKVHDPQRIDFTRRYLQSYRRAGEDGADIRGYFHWSIMDNLEWASAMKHRFGLIHVDFQTQQRTLKDSAYWYREVIQSNGANI